MTMALGSKLALPVGHLILYRLIIGKQRNLLLWNTECYGLNFSLFLFLSMAWPWEPWESGSTPEKIQNFHCLLSLVAPWPPPPPFRCRDYHPRQNCCFFFVFLIFFNWLHREALSTIPPPRHAPLFSFLFFHWLHRDYPPPPVSPPMIGIIALW